MDEVLYGKDQGVATITINRPQRRNALTADVVNRLRATMARANLDPEIRSIVVTGEGDAVFCAGGDLAREAADPAAMAKYEANKELADFFREIRGLKKPIIARVNGHALGVGFAIVLACDLAIAVEDARMGSPELKVGLFPMLTLTHLSQHVGPKKAFELLVSTRHITAPEAENMGLINASVPRADLDARVADLTSQISEHSPVALRLGRNAFHTARDLAFNETVEYLLSQLTLNIQTEDAKEGTAAFLQKRPPVWKGR